MSFNFEIYKKQAYEKITVPKESSKDTFLIKTALHQNQTPAHVDSEQYDVPICQSITKTPAAL